ncbi:MAG: hypothetical protein KJ587_07555 [Alphaproteobacteria bacterium]|nr:hypothetical protein [Alphaproteobacteria bacterium]
MIRTLIVAMLLAIAGPVLAHSDSKFIQGPNGGHIIDAGGGAQHWELVANNGELVLYVTDSAEKPVDTAGGKAEASVLVGGKTHKVTFAPAGENTMKATGDFETKKGMKVIVKTDGVGGKSFQARLTPLK